MSPDVTLQQPGSRETLSADVTLARLVVRPQMHGKGRHGDVNLSAVRTSLGFLIRERPVDQKTNMIMMDVQ